MHSDIPEVRSRPSEFQECRSAADRKHSLKQNFGCDRTADRLLHFDRWKSNKISLPNRVLLWDICRKDSMQPCLISRFELTLVCLKKTATSRRSFNKNNVEQLNWTGSHSGRSRVVIVEPVTECEKEKAVGKQKKETKVKRKSRMEKAWVIELSLPMMRRTTWFLRIESNRGKIRSKSRMAANTIKQLETIQISLDSCKCKNKKKKCLKIMRSE